MSLSVVAVLLVAYLIGAFPSAYLVGRYYGVNLRQLGDGNLGARNTYTILGWRAAILVCLLDMCKGAFAVWLASRLSGPPSISYFAAWTAALGHDFSVYIHFQGGQGMATSLGSLLILQPHETLLGISLFLLVFIILRNWDWAWVVGFISIIGMGLYWGHSIQDTIMTTILIISMGIKKMIDLPLAHSIRSGHP
jgi:glycerol-3-phosphate acyltransferase PlsY